MAKTVFAIESSSIHRAPEARERAIFLFENSRELHQVSRADFRGHTAMETGGEHHQNPVARACRYVGHRETRMPPVTTGI